MKKDGWVGSSVSAYKFVYPRVSEAILSGQDVEVTYIDYDGEVQLSNKSTEDVVVATTVMDKLSEISGEVQLLSAKLDGRKII